MSSRPRWRRAHWPQGKLQRDEPPSPAAKWRGRPHESLRFFRSVAVVIATAITAFLIVACWSLLGGFATYSSP